MDKEKLLANAKEVLKLNYRETYHVPSIHLYPHQWLWDSCFIGIGLRHLDIDKAMTEITSLFRGQWANGMMPNIIFSEADEHRRHRELWRSYINPFAPDNVATSGITQPPMLAEAVMKIGEKLKLAERRSWYQSVFGQILDYHQWLYAERDPHHEGLVLLLHPYESGLDNSPPWVSELRKHTMPWWISAIEKLHLDGIIHLIRRDTRYISADERMSNIDAMSYWAAIRRLRRKAYNSEALLSRSLFNLEDLAFNCILIRANDCLQEIAKTLGKQLPQELIKSMELTKKALEELWDESTGQYYSRSFVSHKLIEESSVATLLPLYSGAISKERAQSLVNLLKNNRLFWTNWPVPSVPINSPYFDPKKYWQGPTWININWLIIEGLERYGFKEEATLLKDKSLKVVSKDGMNEYFNPITGRPEGAPDFSWTAALTIDLLKQQ